MVFNPPHYEQEKKGKQAATGPEVSVEQKAMERHQENLKDYFESIKKITPREKRDFFARTLEWGRNENFAELRRAGISAAEDEKDPLKKYALLSSLYLERDARFGDRMVFKINFGNDLARRKVGLGDMAPPNFKIVRVMDDKGQVVSGRAFRGINPENGRIGYYDEAEYRSSKKYKYIAVFDNFSFECLETGPMQDPETQRHIFSEHREIYESRREAAPTRESKGVKGKPGEFTPPPGPEKVMRIASNKATIEGETYEMASKNFWLQRVGSSPEEVGKFLTLDPITGGPITFLGRPLVTHDPKTGREIPIRINALILPYLKEAEARMREAGIDYNITEATCFNWRPIRGAEGTSNLSMHSWGIAMDLNPEQNPLHSKGTNFPQKFIEIMELCGFRWGGSWRQFGKSGSDVWGGEWGRSDPMHFEYWLDPDNSQKLLKHDESRKYAELIFKQKPAGQFAARVAAPEGGALDQGLNTRITSRLSKYQPIIVEASAKYKVPENLIRAVIWQESGGDSQIASSAGAGGLMQLMPATARGVGFKEVRPLIREETAGGRVRYRLDPADDRADPYKCIMAGAKLLGQLLKQYNGNVEMALAAYNWGSGNVDKYVKGEKNMPRETRNYISNIPKMKSSLDAGEQKAA